MPYRSKTSSRSFFPVVALLGIAMVGCTYDNNTAKTMATTRPADAALKDPFGKWSQVDTDITGGGTSNLNHDALKRDVDNTVFLK